ncbi:hypothetical protein C7999DRAFT_12294 [Corynascus novoguineensis]|uniref:Uncharacterized protein n=1 Tax=Corynascus novoguineensis TaxID=1126955 RepID=A0AAN7CWZ3_9PEZI|nr:hypothetical protein C7999DRAFT_12294 [Corynascus novoguineensis]
MLRSGPALSSPPPPPLEFRSPTVSTPTRAVQPQIANPDNGYAPPRDQLERRTPTPASPLQPSQHQPQHGLSAPRPSLSPLSEYHSGFADEELGSPLNLGSHRRQHSFPNLLPLAFKSRTPSPTRKTHSRSPSEQMPYTGDGRNNGRVGAESSRNGGGGGLVSWLSGSAVAANALGLSHQPGTSKDTSTPAATPTRNGRTTGSGSTTSDIPSPRSATATTAASRFMSALSSRFNPTTPTGSTSIPNAITGEQQQEDELCTFDIEAALFPSSPSSLSPSAAPRDPFSPSAFKNLHMNAAGLLGKMQAAYRAQAAALRDLRAERAAERDELDEAVTRAAHLKMQLEGMARKAAEQDVVVRQLEEELERERKARAKAEAGLAAAAAAAATSSGVVSGGGGAPSVVSEDLGVEEERRRRRRRRQKESSRNEGEKEEEDTTTTATSTDDENESAESESVFSRCRSPPLSLQSPLQAHASSTTSVSVGPSMPRGVMGESGTPNGKDAGGSMNATPRQKAGPQPMGAFQKILKGISGETAGCSNCKGQDASVAWDTVGLLRDENRHLKNRVGELEVAVEGALDLVNGIGL